MSWIINGALIWQFNAMHRRRYSRVSGICALIKISPQRLWDWRYLAREIIGFGILHIGNSGAAWAWILSDKAERLQRLVFTTLCHYDCRPRENERPSNAATQKGFPFWLFSTDGSNNIWNETDWSMSEMNEIPGQFPGECLISLLSKMDGFYLGCLKEWGCSSHSEMWGIVIIKAARSCRKMRLFI